MMNDFKEGEYCLVWHQGNWKASIYYRKGVHFGEHLVYVLEGSEAVLFRVTSDEIKAGAQEATK